MDTRRSAVKIGISVDLRCLLCQFPHVHNKDEQSILYFDAFSSFLVDCSIKNDQDTMVHPSGALLRQSSVSHFGFNCKIASIKVYVLHFLTARDLFQFARPGSTPGTPTSSRAFSAFAWRWIWMDQRHSLDIKIIALTLDPRQGNATGLVRCCNILLKAKKGLLLEFIKSETTRCPLGLVS